MVVKGVLPEKEALEMKQSLKEYVKVNPLAKGYPTHPLFPFPSSPIFAGIDEVERQHSRPIRQLYGSSTGHQPSAVPADIHLSWLRSDS